MLALKHGNGAVTIKGRHTTQARFSHPVKWVFQCTTVTVEWIKVNIKQCSWRVWVPLRFWCVERYSTELSRRGCRSTSNGFFPPKQAKWPGYLSKYVAWIRHSHTSCVAWRTYVFVSSFLVWHQCSYDDCHFSTTWKLNENSSEHFRGFRQLSRFLRLLMAISTGIAPRLFNRIWSVEELETLPVGTKDCIYKQRQDETA